MRPIEAEQRAGGRVCLVATLQPAEGLVGIAEPGVNHGYAEWFGLPRWR